MLKIYQQNVPILELSPSEIDWGCFPSYSPGSLGSTASLRLAPRRSAVIGRSTGADATLNSPRRWRSLGPYNWWCSSLFPSISPPLRFNHQYGLPVVSYRTKSGVLLLSQERPRTEPPPLKTIEAAGKSSGRHPRSVCEREREGGKHT